MLTLDLECLSETELKDTIAGHCAPLGTIKNVIAYKPADQIGYAAALVEMSTAAESDKLLGAFGDSKFGATVVVRLEQEKKSIPVSLKLLADTNLSARMYDMRSCVSSLPGTQQAAPAGSGQRAPIDILLVEDDPADVRMTREALQMAGIRCHLHVVEDGMAAISFLCQTRQFNDAPKPDIILLDLNIPRINGHEVLGEIKSNDRLKDIPIVVLTCSKSVSDLRKSYLMKADRFMTKAMGLEACTEQIKSIAALAAH